VIENVHKLDLDKLLHGAVQNTGKVLYDAGRKVRVFSGSGHQGDAVVLEERLKLATRAELGDGSVVKPEKLNARSASWRW
jgi:hypothetical protein